MSNDVADEIVQQEVRNNNVSPQLIYIYIYILFFLSFYHTHYVMHMLCYKPHM